MSAGRLSDRALGRATLSRQLLLERTGMDPLAAVEHLVGLQAQIPLDPYTALWSRLDGFRPEEVGRLLEERALVRIVVMRGTIHLLSAEDALVLRPLMQPVLDAELARHGEFKDVLNRLDLVSLMARLRPLVVEAGPVSPTGLRALIEAELPELDARALAYASRNLLDMVQVPPRGVWGRTGQVRTTPLDSWLDRPLARRPSLDAVVLRYFAAFGPASVADVAAWCRLTGMREVVDRLRPQLRPFRDERGRELWDLPDAARPDPDTPAPVRFLPEYDNALLSHADRSRFQAVSSLTIDPPVKGTVLHDGLVRAVWHQETSGTATARLVVRTFEPLSKRVRATIAAEGRRLLRFTQPEADGHEVRVERLA
ncbi:MAG: winged helix DNA-binding domain-containing protein [Acidimicrobiales bacterium]